MILIKKRDPLQILDQIGILFWAIYIHKINSSTIFTLCIEVAHKIKKIDITCNNGWLFVCQIGTLFVGWCILIEVVPCLCIHNDPVC